MNAARNTVASSVQLIEAARYTDKHRERCNPVDDVQGGRPVRDTSSYLRQREDSFAVSSQTGNWLTVVNVMRSIEFVIPGGRPRDAQILIDRGRYIFRFLRTVNGILGDLIRRADYCSAFA